MLHIDPWEKVADCERYLQAQAIQPIAKSSPTSETSGLGWPMQEIF